MKFLVRFLFPICVLAACDLQPRIVSLPDTVGEFISARYPALLADPDLEPEIYNSAATDYGVYASPELYGSVTADDYILYASVNDYVLAPSGDGGDVSTDSGSDTDIGAPIASEVTPVPVDEYLVVPMYGVPPGTSTTPPDTIVVGRGDTLYAISRRTGIDVKQLANVNHLAPPYTLRVGQKLNIRPDSQVSGVSDQITVPTRPPVVSQATPVGGTTTMVELKEITVGPGDTLYSLSRRFAVPVNDLAVMNNLSAPFSLRVGQKVKVPNLDDVAMATSKPVQKTGDQTAKKTSTKTLTKASDHKIKTSVPVGSPVVTPNAGNKSSTVSANQKKTQVASQKPKKISSDPTKKLPTITARSSSKFSWPVRGTILSHFGAKNGGLFNDGINIGASRGTSVKAAENGVVAYAGNEVKGMGNLVIIQHSGGWMTVYAHMDSIGVRRGTRVSVGQKIGSVGTTGKVSRPQLHFEIRKGTKAYNPSTYLK